jgi:hypothetical protein
MKTLHWVPFAAALALSTSGCQSPGVSQTGSSTAIGAGIGAGLGAILANNFGGSDHQMLLGTGAGALLGGALGHAYGQRGELQQQINYTQQQQLMTTVWVQNSNNSKTPVVLRMTEGGQYIGPRGEYYAGLPTQDQLRKAYGM